MNKTKLHIIKYVEFVFNKHRTKKNTNKHWHIIFFLLKKLIFLLGIDNDDIISRQRELINAKEYLYANQRTTSFGKSARRERETEY